MFCLSLYQNSSFSKMPICHKLCIHACAFSFVFALSLLHPKKFAKSKNLAVLTKMLLIILSEDYDELAVQCGEDH